MHDRTVTRGRNLVEVDMVNAGTYPLWQQLAVTEGLSDEALPTVIEALCTTSRAFYGLYVAHYGDMITRLLADHRDRAHCFYLDVPVEETLARHTTKPIADKVGKDELRSWYRPLDLLPRGVETVIPASSSLTATIDQVMGAFCDHGTSHGGDC